MNEFRASSNEGWQGGVGGYDLKFGIDEKVCNDDVDNDDNNNEDSNNDNKLYPY